MRPEETDSNCKVKGANIDILKSPLFSDTYDPASRDLLKKLVIEVFIYVVESKKVKNSQREEIKIAKEQGTYKDKAVNYHKHATGCP